MIETSTKEPTQGVIKKLNRERFCLDIDDELFYEILKGRMDTLIRQPQAVCINKITAYSKTWEAPLA